MSDYNKTVFKKQLEDGLHYQDLVTHVLYNNGISINCFFSRAYNLGYGESILGAEIKWDKSFTTTRNLYIEVAERKPEQKEWTVSGVMRDDHWLYIIGDTNEIFIFSSRLLRAWCKSEGWKKVETATSCGYLIPASEVPRYYIKRITITQDEHLPFVLRSS